MRVVLLPITESNIDEVLATGLLDTCHSLPVLNQMTKAALSAELISADGSHFNVLEHGKAVAK